MLFKFKHIIVIRNVEYCGEGALGPVRGEEGADKGAGQGQAGGCGQHQV